MELRIGSTIISNTSGILNVQWDSAVLLARRQLDRILCGRQAAQGADPPEKH